MSESDLIIKEYSKDKTHNYVMEGYTIKYHEGNFICGDDLDIFLKIKNDKVIEYSYDGSVSTIASAAAGFLADFLVGTKLDKVLTWNYKTFSEKGFEVSNRRKKGAVLALLAVRNAIHEYLGDDILEDLEDLV